MNNIELKNVIELAMDGDLIAVEALIERLEAAENQRDGLLAELRHCAEVFRQYEQLHILKCTDEGLEKAHRNGCLAARAEAAIASVKEQK